MYVGSEKNSIVSVYVVPCTAYVPLPAATLRNIRSGHELPDSDQPTARLRLRRTSDGEQQNGGYCQTRGRLPVDGLGDGETVREALEPGSPRRRSAAWFLV